MAQLQTGWTNFQENLGKTIATSPVLMAGLDGLAKSLETTFGDNQAQLIQKIAKAVDDVMIEVVSLASSAVSSGGFIVKEWIAVEKIFGDMTQVIDGVVLALQYANRESARIASWTDGTGKAKKDFDAIDQSITNLLVSMKQRGDVLTGLDKAQQDVDATTKTLNASIDQLVAKMRAARDGSTGLVGPLADQAGAHGKAGAAADQQGESLTKLSKADKAAADAWAEYNAIGANTFDTISQLSGAQYEGIKADLQRGVSVDLLSKIYGVHKEQITAVANEEKFLQAATDATAQTFRNFSAIVPDLSAHAAEVADKIHSLTGTVNEFHDGITVAGDVLSTVTIPAFSLLPNVVPLLDTVERLLTVVEMVARNTAPRVRAEVEALTADIAPLARTIRSTLMGPSSSPRVN